MTDRERIGSIKQCLETHWYDTSSSESGIYKDMNFLIALAEKALEEKIDAKSTPIDFKKPVKTRDGRKVRIYCEDGGGLYPIHGAWWNENKEEWNRDSWMANGTFIDGDSTNVTDLVQVDDRKPFRREVLG